MSASGIGSSDSAGRLRRAAAITPDERRRDSRYQNQSTSALDAGAVAREPVEHAAPRGSTLWR